MQPPMINSSLVTDKVLVGETVRLKCHIHLPTSAGVSISWSSVTGAQVYLYIAGVSISWSSVTGAQVYLYISFIASRAYTMGD